jgi:hypothetical protein
MTDSSEQSTFRTPSSAAKSGLGDELLAESQGEAEAALVSASSETVQSRKRLNLLLSPSLGE